MNRANYSMTFENLHMKALFSSGWGHPPQIFKCFHFQENALCSSISSQYDGISWSGSNLRHRPTHPQGRGKSRFHMQVSEEVQEQ